MEEVEKVQRQRIVLMLLKGDIYGLPGSEGTVRGTTTPTLDSSLLFCPDLSYLVALSQLQQQ